MNIHLRKYINSIAKFHGVKLKYRKGTGGSYWAGEIHLGTEGSTKDLIDIFCHELAHFKNDIEGKYPIYHREDSRKTIKRMGLQRYSAYALKAEIYTEKVGKELAKVWFPGHKYEVVYKNNQYCKGMVYGYYLVA